jgi:hypothetical protein
MITIKELFQKPVESVMDRDTSNDVAGPEFTVKDFLTKVRAHTYETPFLFVNLTEQGSMRCVISNRELTGFLDFLIENLDKHDISGDTLFKDILDLETKFPPRFVVPMSSKIEQVFNLFKSDLTDVVLIGDSDNRYLGKITRNDFIKFMDLLSIKDS